MSLSDILSNTSLAVCVTAVLFGIFALIRIFTDKEQRKLTLLLFSLPAIAYMVPFFTLFGWMTTEALSNFKVKQTVPPPANLELMMTLIILLQLVVLLLACIGTFLRKKQRIAPILFFVTAGLVVVLLLTDFIYFNMHYPTRTTVISGNSNFVLVLACLRLCGNKLSKRLQTWLPPICFILLFIYSLPMADYGNLFQSFYTSASIYIVFAPIALCILYYAKNLAAIQTKVKTT